MKHCLSLLLLSVIASTLSALPYNLTWTKRTDLTGLPSEVSVYATTSTLNGRAFSAWYAIADMTTGNIEFRALMGASRETPSQFVSDYGSNAYVCTNAGYFNTAVSSSSSYSLVVDRGTVKAGNIASLTRSSQTYYPTRGVLGVDQSQSGSCGWSANVSSDPWLYPTPSPNVEGSTPQAQPSSTFPSGGAKWGTYSAVGGGPLLVKNGVSLIDYATNYELLQSDIYGSGVLNPRTAVGYTADGKMILFVCDGRQTSSQGATLDELAQLMIELGCTSALNLDGGGSSAMVASGTCLNSPSDGSQRAVASAVMFAKKEAAAVPLTFTEIWNYTETSGLKPSPDWTFASGNARAIATDGTNVFVPVRGSTLGDGVRAVGVNSGSLVQQMSMTGVSGGTHVISGTDVSKDRKVLVSNLTLSPSTDPLKIYVYDGTNLTANPTLLLSFAGTAATGTTTARMGDTFTFEGTMTDGVIRMACHGITGKYFKWQVQNGAIVNTEPTVVNLYNANGTAYTTSLGSYPRVYPAGIDSVWIKGSGSRPQLFVQNKYVGVVGAALKNNYGNTALPFTYKGKRYLLSVDYRGSYINAEGVLIDVTAGPDGVEVCRTPTYFGTTGNNNGTDGVAVAVSENGFKAFFLCATEGAAAYSVGSPDESTGIEQPTVLSTPIVYPNPAHGTAYFTKAMKQVVLYSVSGQIVCKANDCNQISVAGLSGFYLLEAIDQDGNVYRNRLMVK